MNISELSREDLEKFYTSLERLHDATNANVMALTGEVATLRAEIILLQAKNAQLVQELSTRESITAETIAWMNAKNNEYLVEIEELREKVK